MDFGLSKGRPKALSQINEAVTPERLKIQVLGFKKNFFVEKSYNSRVAYQELG